MANMLSWRRRTQVLSREYTEIRTFLIIIQEAQKSQFVQYDPKKWTDFRDKVSKASDILAERNIPHHRLTKDEVNEYCHRFMAFQFRKGAFSNHDTSDSILQCDATPDFLFLKGCV